MSKTIYVTSPSLPPLDDFIPYLKKIWDNKWLTNSGEFHKKFEVELAAVTMDGDKVTGCAVDTLPVSLPTEGGVFTYVSGELKTKAQQKDAYGMKKASPIEREWYEQADAFATYAVNKTADDLDGISLGSDGKTDAVAGCTISITAMRQNLLRAINKS